MNTQLGCPNCKSAVQDFQLFEDGTCAHCHAAVQRGLVGILSSTGTKQGSINDTTKQEPTAGLEGFRVIARKRSAFINWHEAHGAIVEDGDDGS